MCVVVRWMDESRCLVYFRVDNPRIKKKVDRLGDCVSIRDCFEVGKFAKRLRLGYNVFCLCRDGGSRGASELAVDDKYTYVVRECVK